MPEEEDGDEEDVPLVPDSDLRVIMSADDAAIRTDQVGAV